MSPLNTFLTGHIQVIVVNTCCWLWVINFRHEMLFQNLELMSEKNLLIAVFCLFEFNAAAVIVVGFHD